jgi:biopolymer transport protein TolR
MAMTMSGTGVKAEINMTPMIDVLLVLLIIFMVIIPAKPIGLPASIPQPAPDSAPPPPPTQIVIVAKGEGLVEVNTRRIPVSDLAEKLLSIFHARPDVPVFIGGDPELEFGAVAQVIDVARGAGFTRIGMMPGRG